MAHAGGIDEIGFVLLPILIFVTLQWLSRRKQKQENGEQGTKDADGL